MRIFRRSPGTAMNCRTESNEINFSAALSKFLFTKANAIFRH